MLKALPAIAAVAVASLLVVPTVSQAAETRSVRVSYADLNLASDRGASVLESRIEIAARTVCEIEDSHLIELQKATVSCRMGAIAGAKPAFNAARAAAINPSVTVLPATITVTAG